MRRAVLAVSVWSIIASLLVFALAVGMARELRRVSRRWLP